MDSNVCVLLNILQYLTPSVYETLLHIVRHLLTPTMVPHIPLFAQHPPNTHST